MEAPGNGIGKGAPAVVTARFPIIITAILVAAPTGINATQPSSAMLGRRIISTPANAASEASQVLARVRSFRKIADNMAVIMGVVKPIAVASANGIKKIDEKNRIVAAATAAPRISCIFGRGRAKPLLPSLTSSKIPSPVAPMV